MNDKSRFDELLIKATAPQGGTPWSSQSVVREEKPTMNEKFGWAFEQIEAHNKATQEKCSIHGGIKTKNLNSVYCCKKATQEVIVCKGSNTGCNPVVNGCTAHATTQESWEERARLMMGRAILAWSEEEIDEQIENGVDFIRRVEAQAKRQEGVRIAECVEELCVWDGHMGVVSKSDVLSIINNHD